MAVKAHVVAVLDEQRAAFLAGDDGAVDESVIAAAVQRLAHEAAQNLRGVLNGTGILLHTNLGRVPYPPEALDAIRDVTTVLNDRTLEVRSRNGRAKFALRPPRGDLLLRRDRRRSVAGGEQLRRGDAPDPR